jgi:hypothetical protein
MEDKCLDNTTGVDQWCEQMNWTSTLFAYIMTFFSYNFLSYNFLFLHELLLLVQKGHVQSKKVSFLITIVSCL